MRYIVRLSLLLLLSHSHVWSSELSDVVTTLRESIVELRVVHIDTAGRGTEGFVSGVMVDSTGLILTTAIEPDSRVEIRHSRVEILPGGGFGVAVELLGTSDVFKISVLRTAAAAGFALIRSWGITESISTELIRSRIARSMRKRPTRY